MTFRIENQPPARHLILKADGRAKNTWVGRSYGQVAPARGSASLAVSLGVPGSARALSLTHTQGKGIADEKNPGMGGEGDGAMYIKIEISSEKRSCETVGYSVLSRHIRA